MNKVKMGLFLKKLRDDKKLSQADLAAEFSNAFFEVSTNAISSWEKGKSIPDIDKLNFLADFYDVTVDDILDGEKYEKTDFDSIYHIHQGEYFTHKDFAVKFAKEDPTTNPIYYSITEEGEMVRTRFKKHILDFIDDNISRRDLEELVFFLKNYYVLDENLNITTYFGLLRQVDKKASNDEKWWEAQRYIYPIDLLSLTFGNVSDEGFVSPTIQRRMNYSEPWEKDALLAMIQIKDPIYDDPNRATSKYIERYEKEHEKPFDKEQIIKNTIRYLIENGAMINREFLSYQQGKMFTTRVIDTLEDAHDVLVKPIAVCVKEDEKIKFFYVENNKRNRFFAKYDYYLVRPLRRLGYTYEEIFNLVDKNKDIPDEVYLKMAKLKGVDVNREIRYIKADIHINTDMFSLEHYWPQYHKEEYDTNLLKSDDLEIFEKELSEDIFTNSRIEFHWVGGTDVAGKYGYVVSKKQGMNYQDFKKSRQSKRTKELLESLDSLTVEQIRNQFFQLGGQEND